MRPIVPLAFALLTLTTSAQARSPAQPAPQLPRIVGGSELRQIIRGSNIVSDPSDKFDMPEIFRRDGSYTQNDGAKERASGTYYFSGNKFCTESSGRNHGCRSVLIDSRNRTWLISEAEKLTVRMVKIVRHKAS